MLDPQVEKAMIDEIRASYGNPSSMHAFGQEVRNRVTKARRSIADALGVRPNELVFTSGGTEGVNTVLFGVFDPDYQGHLITSSIEHSCAYTTSKVIEERGADVTFLAPGMEGAVTSEQVKEAIREDTRLISLMAVNNETGAMIDLEAIAQVAWEANIPLFIDAVCLVGKEPFSIPEGVSAFAISGHKFHAPKGIGALYLRSSFKLHPLLIGGHQENNKRAGTENVPGIIALAEAYQCLEGEFPDASDRMRRLRDHFEKEVCSRLPDVVVNGSGRRVVNTSNLSFLGVDGESLLMNLDLAGIAVSHGSACSTGALEPSRTLLNMGADKERASTSVRFSLSRFTTQEEIDLTIDLLVDIVQRLRSPKTVS